MRKNEEISNIVTLFFEKNNNIAETKAVHVTKDGKGIMYVGA